MVYIEDFLTNNCYKFISILFGFAFVFFTGIFDNSDRYYYLTPDQVINNSSNDYNDDDDYMIYNNTNDIISYVMVYLAFFCPTMILPKTMISYIKSYYI
jgi:hypothetical protein